MLYKMYNDVVGAAHEARDQEDRQLDRLILPKELLARLGLSQGDSVVVSEGPDDRSSVSHDQTLSDAHRAQGHAQLQECAESARRMTEPRWLTEAQVVRIQGSSCASSAARGVARSGALARLGSTANKWAYE